MRMLTPEERTNARIERDNRLLTNLAPRYHAIARECYERIERAIPSENFNVLRVCEAIRSVIDETIAATQRREQD